MEILYMKKKNVIQINNNSVVQVKTVNKIHMKKNNVI